MLPIVSYGMEDCLERVDRMGVFPAAALQILELTQREDARLDELEDAVALDAVLAARVLRVANSPMYGVRLRVGSLRRALQVLGFNGTRDVAIALALASVGGERSGWGEQLWLHNEATAWCCRTLARQARGLDADTLFVAGLLHDVGLQLLLAVERDATLSLLDKFGERPELLLRAEQVHYGFDHAKLGGECMRRWKLPDAVAELVERHHVPVGDANGSQADPRSHAVLAVSDHLADPLVAGADVATLQQLLSAHPAASFLRISRGGVITALELLVEGYAAEEAAAAG